MQKELEELQPKLVTAREENAKMMVVIERESVEVEARSKVVRKDEEVANEKAAEAKALKEEVRGEEEARGGRRGGREGTGGWKYSRRWWGGEEEERRGEEGVTHLTFILLFSVKVTWRRLYLLWRQPSRL